MYTCRVDLSDADVPVEREDIPFGIRMLSWSTEGFRVNGKDTLLRGGCMHQDNGILGACTFEEAEERRVRILKTYGFNAVRCAHNPCSRALLRACDRLGMYLIDETWDMWYQSKTKYDYASRFLENYEYDLRAMVRKDYNHPSVILYSVGNEISEPAEEKGMAAAGRITALMHELDASRAVTAGINLTIIAGAAAAAKAAQNPKKGSSAGDGGQKQMPDLASMDSEAFNQLTQAVGSGMNQAANSEEADAATSPVLDLLDVAGYNYASGRYPLEKEKHPDRILYGSETFPQDIWKNWQMVKAFPYLAGDFMWTAWDYLGEAGCGAWSWQPEDKGFTKAFPWLLAGAGAIDLTGSPTGEALYARTVWGLSDSPEIAVRPVTHAGEAVLKSVWRGTNAVPSWSWRGCEGKTAVVEVYSDAAAVELRLNGTAVGRKETSECRCIFELPYQPGTLTAAAYSAQGEELSSSSLRSAEGEIRPAVHIGNPAPCRGQLVFAEICMKDESGRVDAASDHAITVAVTGGTLLGFGSGNPRTEERYVSGTFTSWYGRALAAVRVDPDCAGSLVIHAEDTQTGAAAEECIQIR